MEITKALDGDLVVLTLSGKLDTLTAPELQDVLIPELNSKNSVVLDFSGLSQISSAGLRVLLMSERTAKMNEVSLTLKNVSSVIEEIFNMTGFSSLLSFE